MDISSWLGLTDPPLLGIDIGATSVKLVELARHRSGEIQLLRCASHPLAPGWVVDGAITKADEVANAIALLVSKSRTKTRNVALALPSSSVITRRILLPANLTENQMEAMVFEQATQYIPFAIEEVSLDFCQIGLSVASPGDVDVLLAATRSEMVGERQALADAVGLKAVVMDVESLAARSAAARNLVNLPNAGRDFVIALFELGSVNTRMHILRNDEVLYERDQASGARHLTQMIASRYGFSGEEAEARKRSGDLPPEYAADVLAPYLDTTAHDVARALQFFFTSTPFNKVDYVLLSGGGACQPGLREAVTGLTSYPCMVVNPFEGMSIHESVNPRKTTHDAPAYLTATGLALRRFS